MDLRVRDKFQPRVEITSDTPDPSIINRVVRVATSVSSVFSETATGELTVYRSLTEICSESAAAAAVDRCGVILDAAGHGACDLAITASGALNLCAVYEGDTAHYPAVSLPERHMVSLSNSFVELLSITPAPYILGQSAQADFRVTSPDGSPQTGMVAIYAGKTRLCSAAAAAGKCSFTLPQPNLLTLYAAYAGELDGQIVLQPSTSDPQTITVFAPPTAIRLSTLTVDAYRGETSVEAKLSAVDPNPDDQFVFTLVSGDGDEDNRYFRVRGDQLFAIGNIPYGDGWVNIRLRAVDQTGLSVEESFQLRLNNNQPLLPNTGFAPHRVSAIPAPKTDYASYAGLQIEIPVLGSQAAIVGVPLSGQEWDTSWLGNQAGWLADSAFPGWVGNSYLAAHNYLPSGLPGPFENIADLRWGDQVLIHAYGTTSVYEVRSVQWVSPNNKRVLTHEEDAWLTLVTCDQYDETQQAYRWRVVVRAALVDVE
jgi:LPXTG-site transpeptidase (sortase) family protein